MFCENCGKPVPEQAVFCENCGTKVERNPKPPITLSKQETSEFEELPEIDLSTTGIEEDTASFTLGEDGATTQVQNGFVGTEYQLDMNSQQYMQTGAEQPDMNSQQYMQAGAEQPDMNSQQYMQAGTEQPIIQPQQCIQAGQEPIQMPPMGNMQYQQTSMPVQGAPQAVAPTTPMSLWRKIFLAEIVAVVVLVYLFSTNIKKVVSPNHIAEKFFVATMCGDAQGAYELLAVNESDFVNEKQFKETVAQIGCKEVSSYEVVSTSNEGAYKQIDIAYRVKEDKEVKYFTVQLDKAPKKKWLFFDQWQVNAGNYIAKDITFRVMEGVTVRLNDIVLDDKYKTKNENGKEYYSIPKMFEGVYNVSLEHDLYETISEGVNISYDELECHYGSMPVKEEIKAQVSDLAKEHWKNFMHAAIIERKDFSEISDIPMVADTTRLEEAYDYLKNAFAKDRTSEGQLEMKFDEFQVEFSYIRPYYEDEVPLADVCFEANYSGKRQDYGWFTSEMYDSNNYGTYYAKLQYMYDGKNWLLSYVDLYNLYY